MQNKQMLLINGSSRKKGTSFSFSRTIKLLAEQKGSSAEIVHVMDYFEGRNELHQLRELIAQSDIIGIVAPLYADTLPYPDIWLLEKLAAEHGEILKGKALFGVGQCGFPDITRIEPLLDSCRLFALETGMEWLGGLAYGGGAMLDGAMLEQLGRKGEKLIKAFDLAVDSILKGEKIGNQVQEMMKLKIPKIVYPLLVAYLNNNAKKMARKSGNPDYKRKVYLE